MVVEFDYDLMERIGDGRSPIKIELVNGESITGFAQIEGQNGVLAITESGRYSFIVHPNTEQMPTEQFRLVFSDKREMMLSFVLTDNVINADFHQLYEGEWVCI